MFEELEQGVALRDLVEDILREGPRSISQIGKALAERGVKLHRLAVAGYLKALTDTGHLEEREIPPAKVYALRPAMAQHDIYRQVAQRCRDAGDAVDPARLYLHALHELFLRPIFHAEFRRGGLDPPPTAPEVTGDERHQARRVLSKSPLKLPFNDPAYRPMYSDPEDEDRYRAHVRTMLAAIVRDEYRAGGLAMTTKQSTLGVGE